MSVNLPEYKPRDFISSTTYHFPSIFNRPEASSSEQPEETFSIYSNPPFETKECIPLWVPKLVLKTPLKFFRISPPPSPPTSSPTLESPYSSSTSSSSYTSTKTPHTPPRQPHTPSGQPHTPQASHTPPAIIAFQPIVQARYAALVLTNNLDAFPAGYLKYLPKYNGETGLSAEDHLQDFLDFADNINIEKENVYMRLFV